MARYVRKSSLADVGEGRLDALRRLSSRTDRTGEIAASNYADAMHTLEDLGLLEAEQRASNPFRFDWMGEPHQYEARLRNYRPLTDAQYERMLECEDEARQRHIDADYQDWYENFIEPWRH